MGASESKDLKLHVQREDADGIVVYDLAGSIEVGNVDDAKEAVASGFEGDAPKILFDLSRVEYIDSAGLGFLIGSLRRAAQAKGTFKVCGLSAYLTGVFKIVNLQNILEVHADRAAALETYE